MGTATLEFADGMLGTISNCRLSPVHHVSDIELWTDKGVVEFNQTRLWVHKDRDAEEIPLPPPPPGVSGHFYADKAFVDAVRSDNRALIRTPYREAVRSLAVSLAATESAEIGQSVLLS